MASAKDCAFVPVVLLAVVLTGCGGTQASQPASQGSSQPAGGIQAVQHVVVMVQENRSFDHYFGFLNEYRASQGLAQDVDGTPANARNIGYQGVWVNAFHLATECTEDLSPSWNESHPTGTCIIPSRIPQRWMDLHT
jgi:phospholipase C